MTFASEALLAEGAAVALLPALLAYLTATVKIRRRKAGSIEPSAGGRRTEAAAPPPQEMQELRKRVDELAARQLEMGPELPVPSQTVRPGFNLTRRYQALRLHRRGETAGQIASALEMPSGEVRLLIKLHRILTEPVTAHASGLKSGARAADKTQ